MAEKTLDEGQAVLLATVYAFAANDTATTWDAAREAKRVERQSHLEDWGQELRASSVGQLILACDGLKSGRGSSQGQHDDGFEIQSAASNVLSLHYLNPPRTSWVGELIAADLSLSEEGDEIWGITFLNGIYQDQQIIGGYDHGFRNVGVYERSEFNNEQGAYKFLVSYIQTHDCAQTLRQVIGRNLTLAEAARKKASEPVPTAQ